VNIRMNTSFLDWWLTQGQIEHRI